MRRIRLDVYKFSHSNCPLSSLIITVRVSVNQEGMDLLFNIARPLFPHILLRQLDMTLRCARLIGGKLVLSLCTHATCNERVLLVSMYYVKLQFQVWSGIYISLLALRCRKGGGEGGDSTLVLGSTIPPLHLDKR